MQVNRPRGGRRDNAGRKAADGAQGLIQVSVTIRPDQKAELHRLGGSVWVRKMLDDATEGMVTPPSIFPKQEKS
jgi:hypothetical protein